MIDPPRPLHLTPPDARRAGLVVLGAADDVRLGPLCAGFAEQGYEVMAPPVDEIAGAVDALAGPVVVLAIGAACVSAWAAASAPPKIAALSLFDPPLQVLDRSLACPVIVHLSLENDAVHSTAAVEAVRERWPELAIYPYRAAPGFIFGDSDAARLARLRTLQLFHRAGGKAEMGG